jgi:CRISPR-associated protein (TIGR03986 family)
MDMEKASMIVRKTKKCKIVAEVKIIADNKVVPVQGFHPESVEMDGMEVEVLREKGQAVLIRDGEKALFDSRKRIADTPEKKPEKTSSKDNERLETEHIEYVQHPAYAPYNFIPLNKKVVTIDIDTENRPYGLTFDAYHINYYTGWIDIQIETITPIFIRSTKELSGFYAPSGKPAIPGSSLRGMTRQMVEMVSFGKFGFFNDKKTLYYRGLADRSNLGNEYRNRMSSYDRNRKIAAYKVFAGIIRKKGLFYFIIRTEFDRIPKGKAKRLIANLGKKYKEFEFYDLQNLEEYKDYYLVVSGNMKNKKHDWLIKKAKADSKTNPDKKHNIPILDEDIRNYKNDNTRKVLKDEDEKVLPSILNLIDLLDKGKEINEVPCFYVMWKDKQGNDRVSFGHTAMFRLAYEKSSGDHVPKELTDNDSCDIAGAIFGNETHFAGRVFFDDALIRKKHDDEEVFWGEKYHKILSGPKPTTFQHYLVQTEDNIKNRKHYNSNSSIRGNKVYWHKNGNDWEETNIENRKKHPKQYANAKINPIKSGVRFFGRIRFENLSDIELGALLFSLELPDGCYHKIGMGKPIGLGSIKISPKLYLSDRKKRYQNLFAEWTNKTTEYRDKQYFANAFEKHVLQEIGENNIESLWRTNRLKELLAMLHYDTGRKLDDENTIEYMELESFRNRSILPKPTQVVGLKNIESLTGMIKRDVHKRVSEEKKSDDAAHHVTEPDLSPEYIKKIEIDSLWDTYHIKWDLNRDVNVLIGLNGSGKSTVLRLINHVLKNEKFIQENYAKIPNMIKITYDKGEPTTYKSSYEITETKLDKLDVEVSRRNSLKELENKKFEDKDKFLGEVRKKCGNEWVNQNKDELLSQFYLRDLKVKPINDYIDVVLIVTFDRYLTQEESDKREGNRSILDYDLDGIRRYFKTETARLDIDEESDKIKILVEIINTLFEDTGKKAKFDKEKGLSFSKGDEQIDMLYLSSGEKQFIYILLHVFLGSIKKEPMVLPMILLMDEPEISLHVGWQLNFINHIRKLKDNMQIIIASHSPAMTMEEWKGIETHMHTIMRIEDEG